ncbi:MAG: methyltransferase domain-containing protein [Chloroflexota bacterium]
MRQDLYQDLYTKEHEHWWHVGKRTIVYGLLNRYLSKRGNRDSRQALDLGCGTGLNLDHLQNYALATGTDYFEEALHFCRERGHKMICRSDAVALPFPDRNFDIATALDVIEHLDDDFAALCELFRVMKPGGLLIVSVPAYRFLWTYWDDILGHRRRYTTGMMREVAVRAGFRVRKLSYSNALTLAPAMAVRLTKSMLYKAAARQGKQREAKTDFMTLPKPLNNALIGYYKLETNILRRATLPFGLSVVAVLQRPYEAPSRTKPGVQG